MKLIFYNRLLPYWPLQQKSWHWPSRESCPTPHQGVGEQAQWHRHRRVGSTPHPVSQADQISFHPDRHPGLWVGPLQHLPIYDLPECVKGLVLQNHSSRIFMTLANSRIPERSLSEGPGSMVYQNPTARVLICLNITYHTLPHWPSISSCMAGLAGTWTACLGSDAHTSLANLNHRTWSLYRGYIPSSPPGPCPSRQTSWIIPRISESGLCEPGRVVWTCCASCKLCRESRGCSFYSLSPILGWICMWCGHHVLVNK